MRISLILLSIIALTFISFISWSLIYQDGGIGNIKKGVSQNTQTPDSLTMETWKNQIKTDEKIEKLSILVEELAKKNGIQSGIQTQNNQQDASSLNKAKNEINDANSIRISGKLLSLLMPTVTLLQIQNSGIFDLHVFDDSTQYSTYQDTKIGLKVIPTSMSYDIFIKNARALGSQVYSINETKTFGFRSFYLNPPKADTLVRVVIEMEGQSIALEIPKTKYNLLKSLLNGEEIKITSPSPQVDPKTTKTSNTQKKTGVISVQVSGPKIDE